jgi:hypothetical protein
MGPTLLLACLWGIVLAYWLWSRRPLGDPVGSFRHELQVLGSATPARVAPANRLRPSTPVFVGSTQKRFADPREMARRPVPLAVAARDHTRQELRRRRRDVIGVLCASALLTMFGAVLTGSVLVVLLQVLVDVVLVVYVYLLARATVGQGKGRQSGFRAGSNGFVKPAMSTVRLAGAGYIRARVPAGDDWHEPSYGDFGSYASLAISRGN